MTEDEKREVLAAFETHLTREIRLAPLEDYERKERMYDWLAACEYMAGKAASANERKWLPMESAPKGVYSEYITDPEYVAPPEILLRFGDEAISVARWEFYYADGGSGYTDGFAWTEPCSGEPLNLHYSTAPDGWMPLPPPDTATNGGER